MTISIPYKTFGGGVTKYYKLDMGFTITGSGLYERKLEFDGVNNEKWDLKLDFTLTAVDGTTTVETTNLIMNAAYFSGEL